MRIVVNDLAASYGGALTILKQFYNYVKDNDRENEWIFLLSDKYLSETDNIKIVVYPDVKKSGFHKVYFDFISGKHFIENLKPDVVLSLQNIITFGIKVPQYTYIHQSIPYQDIKKFSFFKKNEMNIAFCQYVIGAIINLSAKKADGVIVQTEWMKNAVSKKAHINENKIITAFPDVEKFDRSKYNYNFKNNQFFYPTNNEIYKNIDCIINACNVLNKKDIKDFKVYLTLPKGTINHKNIECVGYLDKDKMLKMYASCSLIFPSYIETIGLPLLEAKDIGTVILSSDCPYSRESVGSYSNAYFFDPFNSEDLAELMYKVIANNIHRKDFENKNNTENKESSWKKVLTILTDK